MIESETMRHWKSVKGNDPSELALAMADFAREMEKQRDEARQEATFWRKQAMEGHPVTTEADTRCLPCETAELEREPSENGRANGFDEIESGSRPPLAHTAWVMRHVAEHLREGGSYRHLIYGRMGYGLDAYTLLESAGGMEISNAMSELRELRGSDSQPGQPQP